MASSKEPLADRAANLIPTPFVVGNGGTVLRYAATLTLTSAELGNTDGWVVVRVRGPASGMYPVALESGRVQIDPTGTNAGDFATFSGGRRPFALGNPIFLDRDGNGFYDAPFPLEQ